MIFIYMIIFQLWIPSNIANIDPFSMYLLKDEILEFETTQYPKTENINEWYDFIIVGAGAAGCVLANRLTENKAWTVLLIEAGDYESIKLNIPGILGEEMIREFSWNFQTEPTDHYKFHTPTPYNNIPVGKLVGGTTSVNAMAYFRGNPRNYDRWEHIYLNEDWSWSYVEKYFLKFENYKSNNISSQYLYGQSGPVNIEGSSYHSKLSEAILNAVIQSGHSLTDTNSENQIGFARQHYTIKNGMRFSANTAYLRPIRYVRPNLHLVIKSQVTKILMDIRDAKMPSAIGVNYVDDSQKMRSIYARKEIIVCAGALNTPKLLMLSGIGPQKHLKDIGIPLVKSLPVGENLMDHIYTSGMVFSVNQRIFPVVDYDLYSYNRSGPLSIPCLIEVIGFSQPILNGIPTILFLFQSKRAETLEEESEDSLFVGPTLIFPLSRGNVLLRDTNPFSPPFINPNYLSQPEEVEFLLNGIREMLNILSQDTLKDFNLQFSPLIDPQCKTFELLSDDFFRCMIHNRIRSLSHYAGTCKIGKSDDPTAVVDAKLRVHGTHNLRVIDASIMPESVSGRISGAVYMIAERGADFIKSDWQ